MRLATIELGGRATAAVILPDDCAVALDAAAAVMGTDLPPDVAAAFSSGRLQDVIAAGPAALEAANAVADVASAGRLPGARHAKGTVRLLAPLPSPAKNVFCVGRNYAEHIAEGERAQNVKVGITEVPVFFTKPRTAITGPGATVPIFPHVSTDIDYEVELTVIIGRAGRDIPRDRALEHVFGYTIVNDVTARDVQRRHGGQYFKGKGLDGSCPIGPWIVTADEIPDPSKLGLRTFVNGELRQNGNTADMIFDIPTLIASLSEGLTLEPGDILATGTPSGVGYAMNPPQYLKDGDVVVCEVDGIGRLENTMRTEGVARRVA
jgi:2-keto-4-pentenoate hydratase/2-oxohepta-3-ene-1,7-dioic acid hydratase in catechol pathway